VTSVVYELCWILTEKYVLVFLVSCGFSVDFSFVTVFGDRSLNLDFLGHDFLVAHPIYFDFLSSGAESLSCPCSAHTSPACPLLLVQSPARSRPFVISDVLSVPARWRWFSQAQTQSFQLWFFTREQVSIFLFLVVHPAVHTPGPKFLSGFAQ
jgi:hypothetical protein